MKIAIKTTLVRILSAALTATEKLIYKKTPSLSRKELIKLADGVEKTCLTENNLLKKGFIKLNSKFIEITKINPMREETRGRGGHTVVQFFGRSEIERIANSIISNREIQLILFNAYGMKYSADYIFCSRNSPIPKDLQTLSIYSNTFHQDMMYSSNFVKLFIALEDITEAQGPTEWIGRQESLDIRNLKPLEEHVRNTHKFIAVKGDAILVNTNTNIHRAGIPDEDKTRTQLMVQLNPSKNWSIHNNLYERQFSLESNLPLLRNIGKRIICESSC